VEYFLVRLKGIERRRKWENIVLMNNEHVSRVNIVNDYQAWLSKSKIPQIN